MVTPRLRPFGALSQQPSYEKAKPRWILLILFPGILFILAVFRLPEVVRNIQQRPEGLEMIER